MEIYNEEINDLLAPEHRKLQIHESIEVRLAITCLSCNYIWINIQKDIPLNTW